MGSGAVVAKQVLWLTARAPAELKLVFLNSSPFPSYSTDFWPLPFPPRFTLVYNPLLALVFVSVYWIIGLLHAYFV